MVWCGALAVLVGGQAVARLWIPTSSFTAVFIRNRLLLWVNGPQTHHSTHLNLGVGGRQVPTLTWCPGYCRPIPTSAQTSNLTPTPTRTLDRKLAP